MSSSTSLIGLHPSRGAYLLSSSRTRNTSGRGVPGRLLGLEQLLDDDADDEPLGAVVEVVDVDHADLVRLPVDPVRLDVGGVLAADQMPAVKAGAVEPAQERADGALRRCSRASWSARPRGGRRSARRARRTSARRSACRADPGSRTDAGKSGIVLGVALELLLDAGDEVGDLAALVALLGEQEPQQPVA